MKFSDGNSTFMQNTSRSNSNLQSINEVNTNQDRLLNKIRERQNFTGRKGASI